MMALIPKQASKKGKKGVSTLFLLAPNHLHDGKPYAISIYSYCSACKIGKTGVRSQFSLIYSVLKPSYTDEI